ncbi:hypothetical protein CEUSTIGMA_g11891.t1 [Chlamydomonas eustigma]|uniref:RING-type domain-containing protein n=1 Tax=Chlamydomonas eustigma TaxID=1157962 RepID=A0A250XN10_9CHLO|nr:hypothetical protein CEUSTIGMA_g11891.t1 [Chlamydomonas eustigma]|eukprot:GAX84471.1 hypothetical protein CEUSTIGMA_g11891.t1 [Chlamydomonas eustigma]
MAEDNNLEVWTDFGQKVDLTARLREILINYPEGTSILKELVQNADDAKATGLAFCLDYRKHPSGSLLGPAMAQFQGPALLVYNNSVFSEQDFESISRIGDSVKRGQAGKTGRFGIGFNSIYHLTDVPSFISGRNLVIFDPHCKFIPNISSSNPGKKIDLVSHADAAMQFRDQLAPYQGAFGCNPLRLRLSSPSASQHSSSSGTSSSSAGGVGSSSSRFSAGVAQSTVASLGDSSMQGRATAWPATLFRFPLRTEAQAQVSTISKQSYDLAKAEHLLRSFKGEAQLMMLFLKSITSIQVYEWREEQAGPNLTFSCSVSNQSTGLQLERNLFSRVSASAMELLSSASSSTTSSSVETALDLNIPLTPAFSASALSKLRQGASSTFQLHLTVTDHTLLPPGPTSVPPASNIAPFKNAPSGTGTSVFSPAGASSTRRYLISQCFASGAAVDMALDMSRHLAVPLVPWGAVAADITSPHDSSSDSIAYGQAFCFLPLPAMDLGLPVHVNGFFELSSNRRDVWHGSDLTGAGAQRARWNVMLLEHAVAPAYAALLENAALILGPGREYDRLWPTSDVRSPWQAIIPKLFNLVSERPVAWSRSKGGCWLSPTGCLIPDECCLDATSLAHKHPQKRFPAEVMTVDSAVLAVEVSHPLSAGDLLRQGLERLGLPLLGLPDAVGAMMQLHMEHKLLKVTPAMARRALNTLTKQKGMQQNVVSSSQHSGKDSAAALPLSSYSVRLESATDVPALLMYCLSDLTPNGASDDPCIKQLVCIPLLPVLSGEVIEIQPRASTPSSGPSSTVFLADELELRIFKKHAPHLLLDTTYLDDTTTAKLTLLADSAALNLRLPEAETAAQLLIPLCLPKYSLQAVDRQMPLLKWSEDSSDPVEKETVLDKEWLQALWTWLARQPSGALKHCLKLPLIPVQGNNGMIPLVLKSDKSIAVLRFQGSLKASLQHYADSNEQHEEQLMAILKRLGCYEVDTHTFILPYQVLLQGHVHDLSALGVLEALHAVVQLRWERLQGEQDSVLGTGHQGGGMKNSGTESSAAASMLKDMLKGSDLKDRRLLRASVLTENALMSASSASQSKGKHLLSLLASLPLYELVMPSRDVAGTDGSYQAATGQAFYPSVHDTPAVVVYDSEVGLQAGNECVDLLGECFLEASGFNASPVLACYRKASRLESGKALSKSRTHEVRDAADFILAPKYIRFPSGSELEAKLIVKYLGVKELTACEMYTQHLLSLDLNSVPTSVRDEALIGMLQQLPVLSQIDQGFALKVKSISFLPNNKGVLLKPCQLYDPRNPDLVALLDPEACFPADVFCEELILQALQQLGLRTQPGTDTVIEAARYIEKLGIEADDAVKIGDMKGEDDQNMAVARGKALLAYLEVEAGRLMAQAAELMTNARQGQHGTHISQGQQQSGAAVAGGAKVNRGPASVMGRLGFGLLSRMTDAIGAAGEGLGKALAAVSGSDEANVYMTNHQNKQRGEEVEVVLQSFWSELSRLRWCPSLSQPPLLGLPWPHAARVSDNPFAEPAQTPDLERGGLSTPRMLRPASDMWLSSFCLGVLDGECRSSALAEGLGWSLPLKGGVLATQLLELGKLHSRVEDSQLARLLAGVVPHLYRVISELPEQEFEVAKVALLNSCCVWVGNGFAPSRMVAFKGSLDLSPWLFVIPSDLAPFKGLLEELGATPSFSAQQYVSVLNSMREAAGSTPLDDRHLPQAIAVVQALADLTVSGALTMLFVPDERGVLSPLNELAYNDAPWLSHGPLGGIMGPPGLDSGGAPAAGACGAASLSAIPGLKLVHPLISNLVAERVGVASLRRLLIARSSDALDLGAVPGSAAEAFGQSEALTTRLRHIIQDYPEGAGMMMELLQNADDAGATEVALCLDLNTYKADSTLGPNMSVWQGPAVLAFNNAVFSPQDFQNISHIGQDTKLSKPSSIGRFGLGFNCVYHFTDVPAFVSGDYLVTFDPHARYLPGVNPAQPGLKISFRHADLVSQFPDASAPFRVFGCTLRDHFPGTLFRFPLRTETTAAQSDIKSEPCSALHIKALFREFQAQLPGALIFLKNVTKVSVWIKDQQQLNMSRSSSLQAPIAQFINKELRSSHVSAMKQLSQLRHGELPCVVGVVELSLTIDSSSTLSNTTHSNAQTEPPISSTVSADTNQALGDLVLSPHLTPSSCSVVKEKWMVCNALGTGQALIAASSESSAGGSKMIPWIGLASRLDISPAVAAQHSAGSEMSIVTHGSSAHCQNGYAEHRETNKAGLSTSLATQGRAFCFLPLPVYTGLSVHVNAFFELSSNRRDIWYGDDMSGSGASRAHWNAALLSDALAPAYARLLLEMSGVEEMRLEVLYKHFPPSPASLQPPWSSLSASFYSSHLSSCPIIWTEAQGGKWLPPSKVLFSDGILRKSPALKAVLLTLGLPIASHTPMELEQLMLQLTPGAAVITPALVRAHLGRMQRSHQTAGGSLSTSGTSYRVLVAQKVGSDIGEISGRSDFASALLDLFAACGGASGSTSNCSVSATEQLDHHNLPLGHPEAACLLQKGMSPTSLLHASLLLEYVLSDVEITDDHDISKSRQDSSAVEAATDSSHPLTANAASVSWTPQNLLELNGLPLLPLSNGCLGEIKVKSEPANNTSEMNTQTQWVFCVETDLERAIISQASSKAAHGFCTATCVATGLPHGCLKQLRKLASSGLTNICPLSPATMDLFLLPLVLPASWQGKDLVEQWLVCMVEMHVIMVEMHAIMMGSQVLTEGGWTEGVTSALVQLGVLLLDAEVVLQPEQVVHTSLDNNSSDGVGRKVLDEGQTFMLNAVPNFLEGIVQPPTLKGILTAISAAASKSKGLGHVQKSVESASRPSASLSVSERRQLRAFMLQSKWFSASSDQEEGSASLSAQHSGLSPELLSAFKSLPIYEVHGGGGSGVTTLGSEIGERTGEDDANSIDTSALPKQSHLVCDSYETDATSVVFRSLLGDEGEELLLPPSDLGAQTVDPRLLSPCFLRLDSDKEEHIVEMWLGVKRMGFVEWGDKFLVKQASSSPIDAVAVIALQLVRHIHERIAEKRRPQQSPLKNHRGDDVSELIAAARRWPIFPSASGQLCCPCDMFHPNSQSLREVMHPSDHFPGAPFAGDSALLSVLTSLGMKTEVDLQVLYFAAKDISNRFETLQHQLSPGPLIITSNSAPPGRVPLAAGTTMEQLLGRSKKLLLLLEELCQGRQDSPGASNSGNEEDLVIWGQLRSLTWCPVMTHPPHPGLPWPSSQASSMSLAPPRLVRPPSDTWLVSATLYILTSTPGPCLCSRLGWDSPPRTAAVAAQLLALGEMHGEKKQGAGLLRCPGGDVSAASASSILEVRLALAAWPPLDLQNAMHDIYSCLDKAMQGSDGDLVQVSLEREGTPWVWVGPPPPHALEACEKSSRNAHAEARLSGSGTSAELQQGQTSVFVQQISAGTLLVSTECTALYCPEDLRPWLYPVPSKFHQYRRLLTSLGVSDHLTAQHYAVGMKRLAAAVDGQSLLHGMATISSGHSLMEAALMLAQGAAEAQYKFGRASSPMLLPDAEGYLMPASQLFFNDADWLETSEMRLAHPSLDHATAEALGVRSLRYHHEVDSSMTLALPCPAPQQIRDRLLQESRPCMSMLWELVELGDLLGAPRLHFVLDMRHHGTQSLLHPGLASHQGPALCVVMPGVTLGPDELSELMAPRSAAAATGAPLVVRGRAAAYGSLGLLGCFALSEVPQVISGSITMMWDPTGRILAQTAAEARPDAPPRAKQYKHAAHGSDLLTMFSDQYMGPWDFARLCEGLDIKDHVGALLLRLPLSQVALQQVSSSTLRTRAGINSSTGTSDVRNINSSRFDVFAEVQSCLQELQLQAGRTLLFLRRLQEITVNRLDGASCMPISELTQQGSHVTQHGSHVTATGVTDVSRQIMSGASDAKVLESKDMQETDNGGDETSSLHPRTLISLGDDSCTPSDLQDGKNGQGIPLMQASSGFERSPNKTSTTRSTLHQGMEVLYHASISAFDHAYPRLDPFPHRGSGYIGGGSNAFDSAPSKSHPAGGLPGFGKPGFGKQLLSATLGKVASVVNRAGSGESHVGQHSGRGISSQESAVVGSHLALLEVRVAGAGFKEAELERWLVSSCIVEPSPSSSPSNSLDIISSVAMLLSSSALADSSASVPIMANNNISSGTPAILTPHSATPLCGLFCPAPILSTTCDEMSPSQHEGVGHDTTNKGPPGACLGALPFLVAGQFYLNKSPQHGKHIMQAVVASGLSSSPSAAVVAPSATPHHMFPTAAAGVDTTSNAGSNLGLRSEAHDISARAASSTGLPEHVVLRSGHNMRALDAVAAAWVTAVQWLLVTGPEWMSRQQGAGAEAPSDNAVNQGMMRLLGNKAEVYSLMPGMASAGNMNDEMALYCLKKMYQLLSRLPTWLLRSGRLVGLTEGYFLSPDHVGHEVDTKQQHDIPGQKSGVQLDAARGGVIQQDQTQEALGPAALAFVLREVPVFQVPWQVKHTLSAAGLIEGTERCVTPSLVRHLLRIFFSSKKHLLTTAAHNQDQNPGNPGNIHLPYFTAAMRSSGSVKQLQMPLTSVEAVELLKYCCSDLRSTSSVQAAVQPQQRTLHNSQLQPGSSSVMDQLNGLVSSVARALDSNMNQSPRRHGQGGPNAANSLGLAWMPPLGLLDPFISREQPSVEAGSGNNAFSAAFDIGTAAMAAAVSQVLGGGAGATDEGSELGSGWQVAASNGGRGAVSTTATDSAVGADSSNALLPRQILATSVMDLDKVTDLRGLPVPTTAGTLVALGSRDLRLFPSQCGLNPAALLPLEAGYEIMHYDAVQALGDMVKRASFRRELSLSLYTPKTLSKQLKDVLPLHWYRPDVKEPDFSTSHQFEREHQQAPSFTHLGGQGQKHATSSPTPVFEAPGPGSRGIASIHCIVGVPWDEGESEGPSKLWLEGVWSMLIGLLEAGPSWESRQMDLSDLDAWPLLPTLGGHLVWISLRNLVLCLPDTAEVTQGLPPPWDVVVPALMKAGVPFLHPHFLHKIQHILGPVMDFKGPDITSRIISKMTSCGAVLGVSNRAYLSHPPQLNEGSVAASPSCCLFTDNWSTEEKEAVFDLLTRHPPGGPATQPIKDMLSSLPIYPLLLLPQPMTTMLREEASEGASNSACNRIALIPIRNSTSSAGGYGSCPSRVQQQLPGVVESLPLEVSSRLLSHQPHYEALFGLVGVPVLDEAKLLANFVIPNLQALPDQSQALVLTKVLKEWRTFKASSPELVASLRSCPFVLNGDGSHLLAEQLYDPTQPLLARVFKGKPVFPAEQYSYPAWLEVLKDIGLVHQLDVATFLAAAKQVEEQGKELGSGHLSPAEQSEILGMADALITYLRDHSHTLLGREFLTTLNQMAVVPATLGLPGSCMERQVLTSYSEAASSKDWPLIWSTMPYVAANRLPPPGASAHIRLRSPPPLSAVLSHIKKIGLDGGEELLGSWPSSAGAVESTFGVILDHLSKEGLSQQQIEDLRYVSLVPVANASRLAAPSCICLRLSTDLTPFAYEVPSSLSSHMPLLRSLGAKDEMPLQALLESLHTMKAQIKGGALNANECLSVIRLLQYISAPAAPTHAAVGVLSEAVDTASKGGTLRATPSTTAAKRTPADLAFLKEARANGQLLVLTSACRLVQASQAVLVEAGGGRLLGRMTPGMLTLVHPQVPAHVALWLGCLRLSDVVNETLRPDQTLNHLLEVQGITVLQAKSAIQNADFVRAAYSIVNSHAPLLRGMPVLSFQQVATALRSAASRLVFVEELSTRVTAAGNQATLMGGSSSRCYEFSCSQTGQLYIARPPAGLSLSWLLSNALSKALGSPGVTLPLQPFLDAALNGQEQDGVLQPVVLPGGYDADLERAGQVGQLGAPLLSADVQLLQLKPLRRYCAGEVVAVNRTHVASLQVLPASQQAHAAAASAAAADAAEKRLTQAADAAGRREDPGRHIPLSAIDVGVHMVYARVAAHCGPKEGETVYYVPLEAMSSSSTDDVKYLLSSQVYSFMTSTSKLSSQGEVVPDGNSRLLGGPLMEEASASADVDTKGGNREAQSGVASMPFQKIPAKSSAHNSSSHLQVAGSAHLIGAVKDLLSAAGLPLDLERAQLLQQAATLKESLSQAQQQLVKITAESSRTQALVESAQQAWQCKVCFASEVDCCFSSCGHLFCSRCADSLRGRCAACRKQGQIIKVFK